MIINTVEIYNQNDKKGRAMNEDKIIEAFKQNLPKQWRFVHQCIYYFKTNCDFHSILLTTNIFLRPHSCPAHSPYNRGRAQNFLNRTMYI